MASLFKTTVNTRYLPMGDKRFIRSDFPGGLVQEEIAWLKENGVTTIVDLRSNEEYEHVPCRLVSEPGFAYHHLPVTVPGTLPNSPEEFRAIYRGMVDDQLDRIVETILNAETKVLYFCGSGQDRTGVVSAALLKKLGYDEETIVADYMETRANLLPIFQILIKENPGLDLDLILASEDNIRAVLSALDQRRPH